jgi:predicted negative regulator of RcsB-dependent stress response
MTTPKNDPQAAPRGGQLNPDSDLPPDADLEERFNDFWKKNSGGIFGGIALGALVVVGFQSYQYIDSRNQEGIRQAFASAQTIEEQLAFATSHPDHQLAAVARLAAADERFSAGEFSAAAELYAEAARGFEDPAFSARALLGQGVSLLGAGNAEAAYSVLQAVALDRGTLDQIRGEAAYHLAVARNNAGDNELALEALSIIDQLDAPGFWEFRAQELSKRLQRPGA